jgi:hypothetical protein
MWTASVVFPTPSRSDAKAMILGFIQLSAVVCQLGENVYLLGLAHELRLSYHFPGDL